MTSPDDCAFPTNPVYASPDDSEMAGYEPGLSIREYMATQIMAGFGLLGTAQASVVAAQADRSGLSPTDYLARVAVQRADSLIAALNEK